jgi:hypothetical protein
VPARLGRRWCGIALACAAASPIDAAIVRLRDGGPGGTNVTIEAIQGSADAGLTVRLPDGTSVTWTWDRVWSVEGVGDRPELEGKLARAADLWRARTRLERDDTDGAEPLFERWVKEVFGQTHGTALVAVEGLLRCRVARGDQVGAVVLALETIRLKRNLQNPAMYEKLPPIVDASNGGAWLCPLAPPFWMDSRGVAELEAELGRFDAHDDEVVEAMKAEYLRAAAATLGHDAPGAGAPRPRDAADAPGVRLLSMIVDCAALDGEARAAATTRLQQRLGDLKGWSHAWARFALGRAMCAEESMVRRQRGVVFLLHIPARFGAIQPWLSGLALADSADVLETLGDRAGAQRLREELASAFPAHPATNRERPPVAAAQVSTTRSSEDSLP